MGFATDFIFSSATPARGPLDKVTGLYDYDHRLVRPIDRPHGQRRPQRLFGRRHESLPLRRLGSNLLNETDPTGLCWKSLCNSISTFASSVYSGVSNFVSNIDRAAVSNPGVSYYSVKDDLSEPVPQESSWFGLRTRPPRWVRF